MKRHASGQFGMGRGAGQMVVIQVISRRSSFVGRWPGSAGRGFRNTGDGLFVKWVMSL